MKKNIKTYTNTGKGLRNHVIKDPKQVQKEIYPQENPNEKARQNEQEDYPGTQPCSIGTDKDKFKKIGR